MREHKLQRPCRAHHDSPALPPLLTGRSVFVWLSLSIVECSPHSRKVLDYSAFLSSAPVAQMDSASPSEGAGMSN
jgi:hypothetical protein